MAMVPEAGGPPCSPGLCLSLSRRLGPPISAPGPGATCAARVSWGSASGSGPSRAAGLGWGRGQETQVHPLPPPESYNLLIMWWCLLSEHPPSLHYLGLSPGESSH